MTKEEKLNKVIQNFSLLPEEKQNHVLGILQALVFANVDAMETFKPDFKANYPDTD